jgi:hypothetical protein
MRAPQHCASHTMNRMPDADCETEMFNGFRLGGSHRVAVYKPILVSSTGPLQGVPSSKLSTGGGSTSRNMEFRKSRPRGATGEYTYPTNGPQTSNSKSAENVSMNPPLTGRLRGEALPRGGVSWAQGGEFGHSLHGDVCVARET